MVKRLREGIIRNGVLKGERIRRNLIYFVLVQWINNDVIFMGLKGLIYNCGNDFYCDLSIAGVKMMSFIIWISSLDTYITQSVSTKYYKESKLNVNTSVELFGSVGDIWRLMYRTLSRKVYLQSLNDHRLIVCLSVSRALVVT